MDNAQPKNAQPENAQYETAKTKASMEKNLIGTFLIIISATAFAMMAIFAKYAYRENLNLLTILSLRFTIAALVMWLVVVVKRQDPRLARNELLALLGLGAMGYGLMSTFFFTSVRLVPASIASILLYTYPVIVTVLSALIYKEAITRYKVISLLISSIGLVMVVGIAFEGLNVFGVLCGFMAAVVYSLYIVISNRFIGRIDPVIVTTYISTSAAIVFNIVGWSSGSVDLSIGTAGWLSILGISIVSSVIAILTFFQGLKLVGPSKASIISTLEPVLTIVVAFMLFGEKMSLWQVVGAGLVIGAVVLVQKDR